MRATYSPDDNKIRLYPSARLESAVYAEVRAAGFIWAPKQEIFVAPMWTPERAELAVSLAGPLQDDDNSLIERAEERAERFDNYSDKQAEQANNLAAIAAEAPGTVGRNTRAAAEKAAQKIEQVKKQALRAFETSEYWTRRAAGAVATAKYKELPAVRARRIKGIEADKRKQEKILADADKRLTIWRLDGLTLKIALALTDYGCHYSQCFPLADFPRAPPASQYEGQMGIWSALDGGVIDHLQARGIMVPHYEGLHRRCAAWIAHCNFRLEYEKAMLGQQGALALIEKKPRGEKAPICNYLQPEGFSIVSRYRRGETDHYPQMSMTKAQYAAIYTDYKGTRLIDGSHRVRVAVVRGEHVAVYLTDSKAHTRPGAVAPAAEIPPITAAKVPRAPRPVSKINFDPDTLKQPVKIAVSDQLFITPRAIAERMAALVDVQPGHAFLEPSAGTGALLGAIGGRPWPGGSATAIEINNTLVGQLRADFPLTRVECADFLEWSGGMFDRILMNPPFKNGEDIKHIKHAAAMLQPGGILVALCAGGPRQIAELRPIAGYWEVLPPGSFKESGTGVNVALLVIRGTK